MTQTTVFFLAPEQEPFFCLLLRIQACRTLFFSMLKRCRPPAEAGAFAEKNEHFLIVQPAKDGGFLYGQNSARQTSGSAVLAEAGR